MITGKTAWRVKRLAPVALRQFFCQHTSERLHAIVVNHCPDESVCNYLPASDVTRTTEVRVRQLNLGEMRNLALSLVPWKHTWVSWDDDDWRPPDFLTRLLSPEDASAFTTRYEYNLATDTAWIIRLAPGFPIVSCRANPLVRYDELDTMEDLDLPRKIADQGLKVKVFDNLDDPSWYVRLIHDDNTSLYAHASKSGPVTPLLVRSARYSEAPVDEAQLTWIREKFAGLRQIC